jgi:hypothetical protein
LNMSRLTPAPECLRLPQLQAHLVARAGIRSPSSSALLTGTNIVAVLRDDAAVIDRAQVAARACASSGGIGRHGRVRNSRRTGCVGNGSPHTTRKEHHDEDPHSRTGNGHRLHRPGPAGPQGPAGPAGPQGAAGSAGLVFGPGNKYVKILVLATVDLDYEWPS